MLKHIQPLTKELFLLLKANTVKVPIVVVKGKNMFMDSRIREFESLWNTQIGYFLLLETKFHGLPNPGKPQKLVPQEQYYFHSSSVNCLQV